MQLRATTSHRTYRYLRLAVVGVVLLLAVSVAAQVLSEGPLDSVSAAYYTPARPILVGALFAVALALLALSGRSVEQALFDVAALLAPVIAVVPTPLDPNGDTAEPLACAQAGSCVPAAVVPEVWNGMLSLAVVGALGWCAAVVLAAVQKTLTPALGATLAVTGVLIAAFPLWAMLSPATFLLGAHYVAAAGFFLAIAAAAVLAAVRPRASSARRRRWMRVAYGVVAVGILAALGLVIVAVALGAGGARLSGLTAALFFVGEAAALLGFAAFWAVQTVEFWSDPDPSLRPATGLR